MILPDYTNSIVNFSCSILKHFNVTPKHNSIPEVDKGLIGKDKVIVFLFDGMGQALIKKHLKEDDFLRKHYLHTMWSTFPPTTVAATTAMLSGLYPIESGWMAWSQYFPELKRNIDVFKNDDSQTKEKLPLPNYQEQRCSYDSIFSQINKANGKEIAFQIMPDNVAEGGPKSIKETIKKAYEKVNSIEGQSFVYSY